jgi:hypothetical protein
VEQHPEGEGEDAEEDAHVAHRSSATGIAASTAASARGSTISSKLLTPSLLESTAAP